MTERPWRNFYGRRHGKKLRPGQQALIETQLGTLAQAGASWEENPARAPIDLAALFPGKDAVWLEIGFGAGEHLVATAVTNPAVGLIGAEPYINGVAALLSRIERADATNLSVFAGDARDLIEVLPAGSIGRVFLNYPDPWPKTRHHKRRFVSPENLNALKRIMAPGAELRLATDIADYARHALEAVHAEPGLVWTARSPEDWRQPWPEWPSTRYEQKALKEGRRPIYLRFTRIEGGTAENRAEIRHNLP